VADKIYPGRVSRSESHVNRRCGGEVIVFLAVNLAERLSGSMQISDKAWC